MNPRSVPRSSRIAPAAASRARYASQIPAPGWPTHALGRGGRRLRTRLTSAASSRSSPVGPSSSTTIRSLLIPTRPLAASRTSSEPRSP